MASRVLQQLRDAHYPAFAATHPLPEHVREAVHCLRCCRTAAVGGHVQACPEGHIERVWYNSCRHRFCPQCAQLQIAQWLERKRSPHGVLPFRQETSEKRAPVPSTEREFVSR